ncbi:MAG: hypothetical protein HY847_05820 [Betaproteobacteria bacterium]|nr:hypothetical protein [Betaproteobacteria bacterium]
MKKGKYFPITLVILGWLISFGPAVATDDIEKIFASACTTCHTAKRQTLDKTRLTRAEWSEAVARMISYGAEVPKQKLPELLDYLAMTRAPASDSVEKRK